MRPNGPLLKSLSSCRPLRCYSASWRSWNAERARFWMRHGIGPDAVRGRWPQLRRRQGCPPPENRRQPFSLALDGAIQAIWRGLAGCSQPQALATEHLLLGIITAGEEAAGWLHGQGLCIAELEAEIDRVYGGQARGKSQIADWEEGRPADAGATHGPADDKYDDNASEVWVPDVSGRAGNEQIGLLRVIDAAANRAREGLRVVEDYVRFVLDDRHLTTQFKQMRHDLAAALCRIPAEHRLAARETQADVGTSAHDARGAVAARLASVLTANFVRLQEALRSLEEFGKLLDVQMAAELEQLRYRAYTLHRAVEITRSSIERLKHARLYVLVDGRSSPGSSSGWLGPGRRPASTSSSFATSGSTIGGCLTGPAAAGTDARHGDPVYHERSARPGRSRAGRRGPRGPGGALGEGRPHDRRSGCPDRRFDALDRAGPAGGARRRQLHRRRADVSSGTKQFEQFPGIELLRAVAAEIRLPAFAIGGITGNNMAQVLTAGFSRIAVREAIISAPDPPTAARDILEQLDRNMADRKWRNVFFCPSSFCLEIEVFCMPVHLREEICQLNQKGVGDSHTSLRAIQWINLTRPFVQFETIC